jgi:hypothetical protein
VLAVKLPGQVTVPAAAITAAITLATSAVTGVVTYTLAEAHATAEFRATLADHSAQIDRLRGLPVEDLKALPARFEVFVAAAESQAQSVAEMKRILQGSVRTAGGKR